MPFIPVPGGIQVNINQRQKGEEAQNTLYFTIDEPITIPYCQAFADAMLPFWIAGAIPLQSNDTFLFSVEVFSLETAEGPYGLAAPSSPTPGEVADPSPPNNVTISCAFKSGLRGRSHRGRNYWVGSPDTQVVDNFYDVDYLASVLAFYGSMMGPEAIYTDARWSICSRFHDNEPRAEGLLIPVTAVEFVDNVVDSQRNRLPGHNS